VGLKRKGQLGEKVEIVRVCCFEENLRGSLSFYGAIGKSAPKQDNWKISKKLNEFSERYLNVQRFFYSHQLGEEEKVRMRKGPGAWKSPGTFGWLGQNRGSVKARDRTRLTRAKTHELNSGTLLTHWRTKKAIERAFKNPWPQIKYIQGGQWLAQKEAGEGGSSMKYDNDEARDNGTTNPPPCRKRT